MLSTIRQKTWQYEFTEKELYYMSDDNNLMEEVLLSLGQQY